jgi:hypothetical protein
MILVLADQDYTRRMKKLTLFACLCCLLALCQCRSAQADQIYETAGQMADECRVAIRVFDSHGKEGTMLDLGDSGHCLGYVAGALDAFVSFQTWRPSKVNQLCIPDAVGMGQSVKIVLKYIDAHPEALHLPAPDIIWTAMHDAFPCPVSK